MVSTKPLPGDAWLETLRLADCSVDVCLDPEPFLEQSTLERLVGERCDGVIGQLTEKWGAPAFSRLQAAGGSGYSNFAVGYDNVTVPAATECGVRVGTTPGILTESTAELATSLTVCAARRLGEAERFTRAGHFAGFLPDLFVGKRLREGTFGLVGAGRIGSAHAMQMVEGFGMDLVYWSFHPHAELEDKVRAFGAFCESQGRRAPTVRRVERVEELLAEADVVALHCALSDKTRGLLNADRLALLKDDVILVNTSRGPVVDEEALVERLKARPTMYAALDVYEREPVITPGLLELPNAVLLPHIGSGTFWTRSRMAKIAAQNVAGSILGLPAWGGSIDAFVDPEPADLPKACPSILNAKELGLDIVGTD